MSWWDLSWSLLVKFCPWNCHQRVTSDASELWTLHWNWALLPRIAVSNFLRCCSARETGKIRGENAFFSFSHVGWKKKKKKMQLARKMHFQSKLWGVGKRKFKCTQPIKSFLIECALLHQYWVNGWTFYNCLWRKLKAWFLQLVLVQCGIILSADTKVDTSRKITRHFMACYA